MKWQILVLIGMVAWLANAPCAAEDDHKIEAGSKDTKTRRLNIDTEIATVWRKEGITPADKATPLQFLRRASLVMRGYPPSLKEMMDLGKGDDYQEKICKKMTDSDEASSFLATNFAEWLTRMNSPQRKTKVSALADVIRPLLGKDTAMDTIVAKLLESDAFTKANRLRPGNDIDDAKEKNGMVVHAELATQIFNGRQIHCARCHDQPPNGDAGKDAAAQDWFSQNDYIGLRSFWLGESGEGESRKGLLVTNEPEFNGKSLKKKAERKTELAKALTDSPFFGKAIVNRMWGYFFGTGLTDKDVDDMSPGAKVLFPKLLDTMTKDFLSNKSMKDLMYTICTSKAFGLSHVANKTNDKEIPGVKGFHFFSRFPTRPQQPDQLIGSLLKVTEHSPTERVTVKFTDSTFDGEIRNRTKTVPRLAAYEELITMSAKKEVDLNRGNRSDSSFTMTDVLALLNGETLNKDYESAPVITRLHDAQKGNFRRTINQVYTLVLGTPPPSGTVKDDEGKVHDSYAHMVESTLELSDANRKIPARVKAAEKMVLVDLMAALIQSSRFQLIY